MDTYDIIVVGGGLAGLSAVAVIAQESDAAIALVEGRGIGSNNPTPLTFVDVVERFDLNDHIQARYRRFAFHSILGNKSVHSYDSPMLVALNYCGACAELLRRGQAAGTVTLILSKASQLQRTTRGHWQVHTADGRILTAPLLIDASGRGLFATRALNLPRPRMFSHMPWTDSCRLRRV
jgi:flavin-dependent dehydrogenase